MGKDFETRLETTVDATPAQVWDAIATGPGISTWFVGRTTVDGGTVHTALGDDITLTGTVTAAEPPHHFAYASDTAPDGRFIAYEYLVEARAGSATVIRSVTSGFLPGDDWTGEYEAMQHGTALFFATLTEQLQHFPGDHANPVTTYSDPVTDWDHTWQQLFADLTLSATPKPGDTTGHGGQVFHINPHTLAVRVDNGFDRYIRGFHGRLITSRTRFH